MAVYAAHLTRTLQGTPSIFQVVAQDALGATVKPAFRKIIEYLSAVYPGKLDWCLNWYHELYLLLDLCLQRHYLKHYAASFSESFYGLHRVPTADYTEFSHHHRLPAHLEKASLALLVLIPYIKDTAQHYAEKWRADDEDGKLGKSGSDTTRRACYRVYGAVHLLWEGTRMMQLAAYMAGSASHSPQLRLMGLSLRPAPPRPQHSWWDVGRGLLTGQYGPDRAECPPLGGAVLRAAEYAAFLVQFLQWWDSSAPRHATAAPLPPPPQKDKRMLRYMNICPVCLQAWRTATVLPVSGLVFCYSCISREVRRSGKCPVTGYPASEDTLRRLYMQ